MIYFFVSMSSEIFSAEISFVIGDVKVERKGKNLKAYVGLALLQGDSIRTGSKSLAVVSLSENYILKLRPGTILKINLLKEPETN